MTIHRRITNSAGRVQGAWPVLLLLLAAMAVPTAGVLWFMTQAMHNERLAVRQRLENAYRGRLAEVQQQIEGYWREKLEAINQTKGNTPSGKNFADLLNAGTSDSVILYDSNGRPQYPFTEGVSPSVTTTGPVPATDAWQAAEKMEYEQADPAAAAGMYAAIAEQAADKHWKARALQAQARCLVKAGKTEAAITLLLNLASDEKTRNATDQNGRLIALDANLFAVQLLKESADPRFEDSRFEDSLQTLVERLNDYVESTISFAQRRFAMHCLMERVGRKLFPTLAALDLAADYLEEPDIPAQVGQLLPTRIPGVWQLASADKTVIALYRQKRLLEDGTKIIQMISTDEDITIQIQPPEKIALDAKTAFLSEPAGEYMPEWQLTLYLQGPDPFAAAADKRIAMYLWTAGVVVLFIVIAAGLAARYIRRQMRLTRLKNDLIATVSHELKTPLASIRLLVDTLLENNARDPKQTRDYLELISGENARLSRLIDNFLTFSRMERNKRAFEMTTLAPERIAAEAIEAVRERFAAAGCRLETEIASGLPAVVGDRDALLTVLLNLLDNAYKYTRDDKHIMLRVYAADSNVCFKVADNGIGLSRRAMKRIFERFYQVDRSLSRSAGGCGLGLSIVKFIVDAHGGTIKVSSEPGRGSTFTVKLPATGSGT